MASKFNLSSTSPEYALLKRRVKAFNERINYYTKRNSGDIMLPEKVKASELRNQILTRKGFNQVISDLNRFNSKTVAPVKVTASDIPITKWEKQRYVRNLNRRNAEAKRLLEQEDTYKGLMGSVKEAGLAPRSNILESQEKLSRKQLRDNLNATVLRGSESYHKIRAEQYKENYKSALRNNLGYAGDELSDLIELMPSLDFYWAYLEDPFLQIGFVYDPSEAITVANRIQLALQEHVLKTAKNKKWGQAFLSKNSETTYNLVPSDTEESDYLEY